MKSRKMIANILFSCVLFFDVVVCTIPVYATTISGNQIDENEQMICDETSFEEADEELTIESGYGTLVEKRNCGPSVFDSILNAWIPSSDVQWAIYNSGTSANPNYTLVVSGRGETPVCESRMNYDDVELSTTLGPYAGYSQYITKVVVEEGITSIGMGSFACLHNLKDVSLPNTLTEISYNAFTASGIEEIDIPDSVTTIRCSFTFCEKLKKIHLPASLTLLDGSVFTQCISLEEIDIPDGVTVIPQLCFDSCKKLKRVKLPSELEVIEDCAFNMNESLSDISIPDTVRKIGAYSFQNTAIKYVNLPEGLETIEEWSFNYVPLEYIEIPSTVTKIETRAFSFTHGLKTVVIPESVTEIGELLFRHSSLTDLYLPPSITYIPDNIFEDCNHAIAIHGVPGSAAEAFANKYSNLTFVGDYHNAPKNTMKSVRQFVERLYEVCLDRSSDTAGMNDWAGHLADQSISGSEAAYGFVFSPEFKSHNYCNECYVEHLYRAFLGRESDPPGKADWIKQLESGKTREEVFNGFALSVEFSNLCKSYGIELGKGISVPKYGTIPTGRCSGCNAEDGVTIFVKRLYRVCLDREADSSGLNDWCNQLWSRKKGGTDVAYGFVFSEEFQNKNLSDEEYVEYLYKVFFDRGSDPEGKRTWLGKLQSGSSRKEVFDGFTGSKEFANLCNKCGIRR